MSTYYEQVTRERDAAAAERAAAPKACPHCYEPINQNLSRWDRIRQHCGSDRCRKAASRANIAERKRQERSMTRERILQYSRQQLDHDQQRTVMEMTDQLMSMNYDQGHQIALQVALVIEAKRCKHDRIGQLEANAALWQRRGEATERQLKARIEELEAELELFTTLKNDIHGIAQDQLRKQWEPEAREEPQPRISFRASEEEEPEDPDRARVLATLAQAGLKPYTGQSEPEEDDTESGAYDEEEYDEE